MSQSETLYKLSFLPHKDALLERYLGKPLDTLRTPAMIIDRRSFAQNCSSMHLKAREWGASFRAHLKAHKTAEGTRLQLISDEDRTNAVVVSTLTEAWGVVQAGLVADQTVKDILYGLPVQINKVQDLSELRDELRKYDGELRLLVDHPDQVRFLQAYESESQQIARKPWSVFVKINGGQNRAGVSPGSPEFHALVDVLLKSSAINLHGFYGHAADAYASTSLSEASKFLSGEVASVNDAARAALELISHSTPSATLTQPFILSVGSTPTAHAASMETRKTLSQVLHGTLELHAGNYPMLDLQQQHTTLIDRTRISHRVQATVISYYPGRGTDGSDEALIDAGAIAFSKDTGPSGGYGDVIGHPWQLSRISQEHGILTRKDKSDSNEPLKVGMLVNIVGQHACLIAAAHPWYYIVDGEEDGAKVVDIWVPWKGW